MIKKKGHAAAAAFLAFMLSGLFLLYPDTVSEATFRALSICASRVIASVFPFSVLSSLLVASGSAESLDQTLSPLFHRLFGVKHGASALVLGLLFGFPLGALTVGAYHKRGVLSSGEASRLLAFVCCASPTFPVFVVGHGYFGSTAIGLVIWGTQAAVSIIIGIIICRRRNHICITSQLSAPSREASLPTLLTGAITDAARVMLNVCGSVTFFSIISAVASRAISPLSASHLPQLCISAVFEFSSGTTASYEAYTTGLISRALAAGIAGFSIGFAGLSVMFQTSSVCPGISLTPHLCGKVICGVITAFVTYIVSEYPSFAPVFSSSETVDTASRIPFFSELAAVVFVLFMIFIFDCRKRGCKKRGNRL